LPTNRHPSLSTTCQLTASQLQLPSFILKTATTQK
jgi:hypothetical protein